MSQLGKRYRCEYFCTAVLTAISMSQLGKRYRCEDCGTEILCTKAGEEDLSCCDKEMQLQEPKPLPSSD